MTRFVILAGMLTLSAGCAKKTIADAEARVATCSEELEACSTELGASSERIQTLEKENKKAEMRLKSYRALAEELRAAYGTDLAIEIRNGRMVVLLPNSILYDSGKSELKPEGKESLQKLAGVLKKQNRNFQVAGHTDNQPISGKSEAFKTNWELSSKRALSAVYFLEKQGVKPAQLAAVGYGEHQPLVANSSPENMKQNRRTEIVVMPRLDEIPNFPKNL